MVREMSEDLPKITTTKILADEALGGGRPLPPPWLCHWVEGTILLRRMIFQQKSTVQSFHKIL